MFVWTQLHGAIALELFGHMPGELVPADDLFQQQMRQVLVAVGCGQMNAASGGDEEPAG